MPVFARKPGWESGRPLSTAQLKEVQEALGKLGLYDARISGIYGKKTTKAIKKYQEMLLAGDGEVSKTGKPVLKYKSGRAIIPDGYPSIDLYETLKGE